MMIGVCCGAHWTEETARIVQEGPHRVARCGTCQKWLRALPGPAHDYVMPFGKYHGARVADLWAQDRPYCDWLYTIAKPRLKQVLDETKP
jgi:hypothetical protein